MKSLHEIQIEIILRAPWLVHGNDPGRLGLDSVQLRDGHGRRILPGTLVVGRLSQAWTEFSTLAGNAAGVVPSPAYWFGAEATRSEGSGDAGSLHPQRTRIFVDDLVCDTNPVASTDDCSDADANANAGSGPAKDRLEHEPAHRVHIDEQSGAGVEGDLQFIEQNEAANKTVRFVGTWRAWLSPDQDPATPESAKTLEKWLRKGLQWQTQLGALRNVGFGQVHHIGVTVAPAAATPCIAENFASASKAFCNGGADGPRGLALAFSQPLAVGNRLYNGNLFVSDDIITGATIKGAMASVFAAAGEPLPDWFNDLRVTHAHPAPVTSVERPLPLPLSLVRNGRKQICDAAAHARYVLDYDDEGKRVAMAFKTDWKPEDFTKARAGQGWGETSTHLRVRTAIKNGKALDKSLFAYECKLANRSHWLTTLDFADSTDQTELAERWATIANLVEAGLGPIGKTDAFAKVTLLPAPRAKWAQQEAQQLNEGDRVRVMLCSPALLLVTPDLTASRITPEQLLGLYAKAFATSVPALTLTHFFAEQELAGGEYLWKRFLRRHPAARDRGYQPLMLTKEGSVFVFRVEDAQAAQQVLRDWQAHGLPLSEDVKTAHGADWKTNPFIPQNGFGEVIVNPIHDFPPQSGQTNCVQETTTRIEVTHD